MKRVLFLLLTSTAMMAQTYTYNPLAYGAKCDGSTDDTAAFNGCLSAANSAGGGVCMVPATVTQACIIAGQINMDQFSGVSLAGPPAGITGLSSNGKPRLLFTGTASPLVKMRSTLGGSIKNIILQYNNPSFAGTFVDLSHAINLDSDLDVISDSTIQGTSSPLASGANPLVSLDKAIDITIERNVFEWAANAIIGPSNSNSYSNVIRIRDNLFGTAAGFSITGNMILNLGQAWIIEGNTFEIGGTAVDLPVAIDANYVACGGCTIAGNWIGDAAAQHIGPFITGNFQSTLFTGNLIGGGGITVGINLSGCPAGTAITGNNFAFLGTAVSFQDSCASNILLSGNRYVSVTHYATGAPAAGIVTDSVGNTTIYGNNTVVRGDLNVTGFVSKAGGSFKIDHPLDPSNKYLSHSFVESPDMMNLYNGVATLDARGQAIVHLPAYFEALNQDFRYQLTPIGAFAPLYVARKVARNRFLIAGGKPGMQVSWQVTGIRHDAYANKHRIVVEEKKPKQDKVR